MKCLFTVIFILVIQIAKPQTVEWTVQVGGTESDGGLNVITDNSGNILSGGQFRGRVDFDPGPDSTIITRSISASHIFISKSDTAGNFIWVVSLTGDAKSYLSAIETDADNNIFIAGTFSGTYVDFDPGPNSFFLTGTGFAQDIFFAKYDANGNFVWAKSMSSADTDEVHDLALDANANIYLTGFFDGTLTVVPGQSFISYWWDYFVAKFDSAGNFIWANVAEGVWQENGRSIVVDGIGNTYTIGSFNDAIDFDPGPGIYNMNDSMDGGGTFFAKYDPAGNLIWAKMIGAPGGNATQGHVHATHMRINYAGNLVMAGFFQGSNADFEPGPNVNYLNAQLPAGESYIAEYDTSGHCNWTKRINYCRGQSIGHLNLDPSGNIYLTGYMDSLTTDFDLGPGVVYLPYEGDKDIFAVCYNEHGDYQWAKSFGGTGTQYAGGIYSANDGSVYITFSTYDTMLVHTSQGTDTIQSRGSSDVVLLKLTNLPLEIPHGDDEHEEIQMFPNPASEKIYFSTTEASEIIIYNALGKEVLRRKNIFPVDISALSPGFYFAELKLKNGGRAVKKFVKE